VSEGRPVISRRAFVLSVAAIGGALVVGLRMSDLAEFSEDGDGKASEMQRMKYRLAPGPL
jgi:hypothetical protein